MRSDELHLTLVPSKDDAPQFSAEYQSELRSFSCQAHASSQKHRTGDSIGGGGVAIGEFIFNHAPELITALTALGAGWLNGRSGRKLRLKFSNIEIEANNQKEIDAMLKKIRAFQDEQSKSDQEL
jgi:hypothetical protein